jgi:muconate cycloisomerase
VKIDEVNVYKISLPFSGDFSISRKKGLSSSNIIVEVIADQGEIMGYGEGVPVEFVAGETVERVVERVQRYAQMDFFPWELTNVSQVWDFVDSLPDWKEHNAAVCALEMAFLDALGKGEKRAIIEYFPQDFLSKRVRYGATITLGEEGRIRGLCASARNWGITHLRLKMDRCLQQNKMAIEIVGSVFGGARDLRVDPNCAWDRELALAHVPLLAKHEVKVVEQPLMPGDPDIAEVFTALQRHGISLMACETVCTLRDVERIKEEGCYDMINVKLYRTGGFRRSLRMIEGIRNGGLAFQIGCYLGESGVLSAAGRTLSLLCSDAAYHDGSYDRFLLKENITTHDVTFGQGGEAGPLNGPGLGIEVNRETLMRLSNGGPGARISPPFLS